MIEPKVNITVGYDSKGSRSSLYEEEKERDMIQGTKAKISAIKKK